LVHRPADLVARYGGEEFAVVLPSTNLEGAIHVANTIAQKVAQLFIDHEYSFVNKYLTLSMGISCLVPDVEQALETLIHQADCALYQAKGKGRNQIQWHKN
jgi:diguanylate cyclase (GGDEF)-like protein